MRLRRGIASLSTRYCPFLQVIGESVQNPVLGGSLFVVFCSVPDYPAFGHVNNIFGDIRGMIGYALKMARG